MINEKFNVDICESIATHLDDEDLRALAQVSKQTNALFSQDKFYSIPANELRQAWRQYVQAPADDGHRGHCKRVYQHNQRFHQFVAQQPPPMNKLLATRADDPRTYAALENRLAFEGAPDRILEIVSRYPKEIPVLDLGTARGATGYIDFLAPEDLEAPVMRGTDCHKRPFLSVKATMRRESGKEDTVVNTIFQRYTGETSTWVRGERFLPLFDYGADRNLAAAPEWCAFLGGLLAAGRVEVPAIAEGPHYSQRPALRVTLNET